MRLVGASDALRALAVHRRGPAHRPGRGARHAARCCCSPRRPSATSPSAIAGQVPVGFTAVAHRPGRSARARRRARARWRRRLDLRAGLPAHADRPRQAWPMQSTADRPSPSADGPIRPDRPTARAGVPSSRPVRSCRGCGRRRRPRWPSRSSRPASPREPAAPDRRRRRTSGSRGLRRGLPTASPRDYVGECDPDALVEGAIEGMFERARRPLLRRTWAPTSSMPSLADISRRVRGHRRARWRPRTRRASPASPIGDGCRLRRRRRPAGSPAAEAGLLARRRRRRRRRPARSRRSRSTTPSASSAGRAAPRSRCRSSVTGSDVSADHHARAHPAVQDVPLARSSPTAASATCASTASAAARPTTSHGQLRAHLDAGIEDLVLDLRDDPGGFVDAARRRSPASSSPTGRSTGRSTRAASSASIDAAAGGLATDPAHRRRRPRRRRHRVRERDRRRRARRTPGGPTLVGRDDVRQGHRPGVDRAARRQRRLPPVGRASG